VAYWS